MTATQEMDWWDEDIKPAETGLSLEADTDDRGLVVLSDQQINLFCMTYMVTMDPVLSAQQADIIEYREKPKPKERKLALSLMHHPDVDAVMSPMMEARAARTGVTPEYVVAALREIVDVCLGRKPRKITKSTMVGNKVVQQEIDEMVFQPGAAKGALELLAKHLRMLNDQVDVNVRPHQEWLDMVRDAAAKQDINYGDQSLEALEAEFEEIRGA